MGFMPCKVDHNWIGAPMNFILTKDNTIFKLSN